MSLVLVDFSLSSTIAHGDRQVFSSLAKILHANQARCIVLFISQLLACALNFQRQNPQQEFLSLSLDVQLLSVFSLFACSFLLSLFSINFARSSSLMILRSMFEGSNDSVFSILPWSVEARNFFSTYPSTAVNLIFRPLIIPDPRLISIAKSNIP